MLFRKLLRKDWDQRLEYVLPAVGLSTKTRVLLYFVVV